MEVGVQGGDDGAAVPCGIEDLFVRRRCHPEQTHVLRDVAARLQFRHR
jgi:hypothetical protein